MNDEIWLKKIDIYGNDVKVFLNKKEQIKTITGGVFTIFTFFIIVAFLWIRGYDFIYKQEPNTNDETSYYDNYPEIVINKTYSPFSIQITDDDIQLPIIDDTFLNIKFEFVKYSINSKTKAFDNKKIIDIPMKMCDYSDFPKISNETYDNLGIGTSFCPDDLNFTIKGFWNEESLHFLKFKILMCDYENNSSCKSKEEIINLIKKKNIVINLFYQDTEISIKNYNNPINNFPSISYKYLISDTFKVVEYFLSTNIVVDNDGLILDSRKEKYYLKLNERQTDVTDLHKDSKTLMEMSIYSSNISNITYRKYLQIPDILAFVGGMVSIFSTFFKFTTMPIFNLIKYENVLNALFEVEIDKTLKLKRMTRVILERNLSDKSNNENNKKSVLFINKPNNNLIVSADRKVSLLRRTNSESIEDIDLQNVVENLKSKTIYQENSKEYFSKFEKFKVLILNLCGRIPRDDKLSKKLKIFNIGKKLIATHYDLVNIIRKFEEIENLKKIIFTDYQKKLFDLKYCSKLKLNEDCKVNNLEYDRDVIENCVKTLLRKSEINDPLVIDENLVRILLE